MSRRASRAIACSSIFRLRRRRQAATALVAEACNRSGTPSAAGSANGFRWGASINPRRAPDIARERAAQAAATAVVLSRLEEEIEGKGHEGDEYSPDPGSLTVLRYGIELNEWAAAWFEQAAAELEREFAGAKPA